MIKTRSFRMLTLPSEYYPFCRLWSITITKMKCGAHLNVKPNYCYLNIYTIIVSSLMVVTETCSCPLRLLYLLCIVFYFFYFIWKLKITFIYFIFKIYFIDYAITVVPFFYPLYFPPPCTPSHHHSPTLDHFRWSYT